MNSNGCILGAVAEWPGMKPPDILKPTTTWYAKRPPHFAHQVLFCEEDEMHTEKRSIFDWLIFLLIHAVLIGGITVAGFYVYSPQLGAWVAASAIVAGFASAYLFAKEVPGETTMKCMLYLCVAMNAAYLVHNGAQRIGVDSYNAAQIEKYERGMAEAGKATSRRIARELRLGAADAAKLEMAFSNGVALWAAILAFLEIGLALIVFAISSRRLSREEAEQAMPSSMLAPRRDMDEFPDAVPTGRLLEEPTGKARRQ